jgi:two-component system, NarL family, response regulator
MIVDDHDMVRDAFAALLLMKSGFTIVGQGAAHGQAAVELFRTARPDIVLMDLRMPVMDGITAITQIRREFEDSRFLVLTTYEGDGDVRRALAAGAQGYLLKTATADQLVTAIRSVVGGQRHLPADLARRAESTYNQLTPREQEVLGFVALGKSNKEIAAALSLSEAAIKWHVRGMLAKLGVASRTEAVSEAVRRGLVHLE